jgi:hypothetical protein
VTHVTIGILIIVGNVIDVATGTFDIDVEAIVTGTIFFEKRVFFEVHYLR